MTVDGQLKLTSAPLTTEEEKERLEANNKTYYDENYQDDIDRYKKIFAERKFNFDFLDEAEMTRIIKRTKKTDKFFNLHASALCKPLLLLNKLIEASQHFPRNLRHSRLTMLPSRVIYSLGAIPKIFETVLNIALNKCRKTHYEIH